MNRLTKKELYGMTPLRSMLLIKPQRGNDEILLSNGHKLFLDTSYSPERHAPVIGEVVAIPQKLNCKRDMDWETDCEVLPGMTVWYGYVDATRALYHDPDLMYQDEFGDVYFLIPYQSCVISTDKQGKVLCLNGYMLCSPIEQKGLESKLIVLLDEVKKFKSAKFAILEYQGANNRWYRIPNYHDHHESVPEGSVIVFSKNSDIPLEYDLHAKFGKKKEFYRMQWPDVMAVVPPSAFEQLGIIINKE